MMKKVWGGVGVAIFALALIGQVNFVQAASDYDYSIYQKSDNPVIKQGESVVLWVKLKNTGSATWNGDRANEHDPCFTNDNGDTYCTGALMNPIRLGSIRPTDRNSGFFTDGNWIATNRVHKADEEEISPEGVASFGFVATVPYSMAPGNYRECFAPVVENITWMADKGICWDIKVTANNSDQQTYQATPLGNDGEQNKEFKMTTANQEETVEFKVKNTGNATWYRDGAYPIHLAIIEDKDSDFYNDSWIGNNRPARLTETQVLPGETGTFTFKITSPLNSSLQYYYDYFWLVAENKQWFAAPAGNNYLRVAASLEEFKTVSKTGKVVLGDTVCKNPKVFSAWGDSEGATVDGNGNFTTTVSAIGAQWLFMINDQDETCLMTFSIPDQDIVFSADSTARTSIFLHFAKTDPIVSKKYWDLIPTLPSYNNLLIFLKDGLKNKTLSDISVEEKEKVENLFNKCWTEFDNLIETSKNLADKDKSSQMVDKYIALADGKDEITLSINLKDKDDNPIAGREISVVSDPIYLCNDNEKIYTDFAGKATKKLTCDTVGEKSLNISVDGNEHFFENWIKVNYAKSISTTTNNSVQIKYQSKNKTITNNQTLLDGIMKAAKLVKTNPTYSYIHWYTVNGDVAEYKQKYDWMEIKFDQPTLLIMGDTSEMVYRVLIFFNGSHTSDFLFSKDQDPASQDYGYFTYMNSFDSTQLESTLQSLI